MPNWCSNDLYIYGKRAEIDALKDFIGMTRAEKPTFDFSTLIPYPAQYAEMDADYPGYWAPKDDDGTTYQERMAAYKAKWGTDKDGFNLGGYDWCIRNWGTKWNACDVAWEDKKSGAKLTFETAWSPPEPVIEALAKRFPTLRFSLRFYEMGMGYKGHRRYEKGELTEMEDGQYRGSRGG